jgi:hypothetical protein
VTQSCKDWATTTGWQFWCPAVLAWSAAMKMSGQAICRSLPASSHTLGHLGPEHTGTDSILQLLVMYCPLDNRVHVTADNIPSPTSSQYRRNSLIIGGKFAGSGGAQPQGQHDQLHPRKSGAHAVSPAAARRQVLHCSQASVKHFCKHCSQSEGMSRLPHGLPACLP